MLYRRKMPIVDVLIFCFSLFHIPLFSEDQLPFNFSIKHAQSNNDSEIVYLFAHGLGASAKQADKYKNLMLQGCYASFNFPDAKEKPNDYHKSKVNIGQEDDIACLKVAFDNVCKECPGCSVVLIGVSRGAITCINFAAQHQPQNLKALVLDSPFDTYESIVEHLIDRHYLGWIPGCKVIGNKLFCSRFPKFNPQGILPINQISKIPNVPVLFIHTIDDELIPAKSSQILYEYIKDRNNVHCVLFKGAEHAHIIFHPETKDKVEAVVHAFYKKYKLPHNSEKAAMDTLLK